MLAHDWSKHPLGPPDRWPSALEIAVGLIVASPESMYIAWGPELHFFFNDAYRTILGPRVPLAIGTTLPVLWPDAIDAVRPMVDKAFAGEASRFEDLLVEMRRYGSDEQTWWTFSYAPIRDESGSVAGLFCITNETTERVKAATALQESEARNRQILDSAIDYAIIATDPAGLVTRWNEGAHRVLGWTETEMLGETAERFFTPEDVAEGRIEIEMRSALEIGRGNDERWHMRKTGERFWAVGEMTVLRDEDGRATGFVKVLRDRTDEHRHRERLRETEARLRRAQEAGGVGVFSIDVQDDTIEGSPEFCRLYGVEERKRIPLIEFQRLVFQEDAHVVSDRKSRAAAEAIRDVEYRIRRADDGVERWISRKGEFEFDEQGRPVRFVGVARDITDQVATRHAMESERGRLARLFEQAPSFMATLSGPDHVFELVNPAYMQLIGHRDLIGLKVRDAIPEIEGQGFFELLDSVYETGEAFRGYDWTIDLQREPATSVEKRSVDFVYQPMINEQGHVVGIFVEGSDVTDRSDALRALRESENLLRSVLASSGDCIKVLNLDARLVFMSEGGQKVMEVSDFNAIAGCPWPDFWHDEGNVAAKAAIASAQAGTPANFQGYAETMKGNRRYWDVQVTPIMGSDGKPERILSVSRDITAMKQAEEVRADLAHELAHRMKNTLAMVQAIVSQTLRNTTDTVEAGAAITGRLAALSRAQDVLTSTSWEGADINEVVDGVLRPLRPDGDRIRVKGPSVELSAQQALGLSLALHELATNAAKYGALSNDEGTVDVTWDLQPDETFTFEWTERGGPTVFAPTRTGFGSRLMERIVASYFGGKADLSFAREGLKFRLDGDMRI